MWNVEMLHINLFKKFNVVIQRVKNVGETPK